MDNAMSGKETSNYELEYLLVNTTTRRDINNNVIGGVGVAQDVTEAVRHYRAVAAMSNGLP